MKECQQDTPKANCIPKAAYTIYSNLIEDYKSRIEDLESTIEINKKMIYDLIHLKVNEFNSENSDTVSNFSPKVLESMLCENISLNKKFNESLIERNKAQSKALLSQQIGNEVQLKLHEIEIEYEEKIKEYQFQLDTKNKVFDELRHTNNKLNELKNFYFNSINTQIIPPKDEIIDIHTKTENLKEFNQISARNYQIASIYRENILNLSNNLYGNCQKIQALLKNPINRRSMNDKLEFNPPEEFSDKSDSFSESSEIEISDNNRSHTAANRLSVVPAIDFSKIHKKNQDVSMTLHNSASVDFQKNDEIKEEKQLYKLLNDKIAESSVKLEKICKKNKLLQDENVKLTKELLHINQNVIEIKLKEKRILEKKHSSQLEKIIE